MARKYTRNELTIIGAASIAEDAAKFLTLGFYRPKWGNKALSVLGNKDEDVEWAIEFIEEHSNGDGLPMPKLRYKDVLNYIKSKNCKIIRVVPTPHYVGYEFAAHVKGKIYVVGLELLSGTDGSFMYSRKVK